MIVKYRFYCFETYLNLGEPFFPFNLQIMKPALKFQTNQNSRFFHDQ